LCTHAGFTALFYENFYDLKYVDNVFLEKNINNKCIIYADEFDDNPVAQDAHKFGFVSYIGIMKTDSYASEVIYFASSNPTAEMQKLYFANLDFLKKFSLYFKEQAAPLIKLAYDSNLLIPKKYDELIFEKIKRVECRQNGSANKLAIQKYFFDAKGKEDYLTQREIDCIEWCAKGKTAAETGIILGIAAKTVELHLYNSRKKLNCANKCQLVAEAFKLDFLQA